MNVIYAHEEGAGDGIFLAGPSPREDYHLNWRPDALEHLQKLGYEGEVYIPLPRTGRWGTDDYESQIEWEVAYLNAAKIIAFWIPRTSHLPGFTTNVEFGEFLHSKKIILGYPESAEKMKYLAYRAKSIGVPIYNSLETLLSVAQLLHSRGLTP